MAEEDLYDLGLSFIRPRLANVKGASIPLPYGGKVRQVQVDVDPNLMYSHHIQPTRSEAPELDDIRPTAIFEADGVGTTACHQA